MKHAAYTELMDDGVERTVWCGDTSPRGDTAYCPNCQETLSKQYPQGWSYHPGDRCRHGNYIGGCGPDYMCHDCEMGYNTWVDDPEFVLMFNDGTQNHKLGSIRWNESGLGVEELWGFLSTISAEYTTDVVFYATKTSQGYWDTER